jgi:C1A family cysteine protease
MSQPARRYGYRRSPTDARDKIADPSGLTILPEVDLRVGPMPLVYDQLSLGACTSNAVAACLQYDLSLDRNASGLGNARRRSRLDLYYGERSLEGELGQGDTGAYGRDGFKYAQQTGVLLEERWPYDITTFEGPPPSGYKRHKLVKPYAVVEQDADHVQAVLSNRQLIAFGFSVYESFEDDPDLTSGIVPMPSGKSLGGHEMVVVGYLAHYPDHALVRNSWGSSWSPKFGGYCLFPWAYLLDPSLASDLRTIVRSTA